MNFFLKNFKILEGRAGGGGGLTLVTDCLFSCLGIYDLSFKIDFLLLVAFWMCWVEVFSYAISSLFSTFSKISQRCTILSKAEGGWGVFVGYDFSEFSWADRQSTILKWFEPPGTILNGILKYFWNSILAYFFKFLNPAKS